jgi:DNA-binding transcriptional LysR family regulator
MGDLEESLGIALFDKSKKPYLPTAAALRLAASCERFVREVEEVTANASGQRLPISVGAGEVVIRELLGPWIGMQRKNIAPQPWVMRNLKWRKIQESLASELLDVGIADGLESNGNVVVVELESYSYKLVLPVGLKPNKSGWKMLEEIPVVLLEGAGRFRRFLTDCEREHGFTLKVGAECTTYPQAVDLAEATGCAVFIPEYWWKRDKRFKEWQLRTQALPGLDKLRRTLKLGWNRKIVERRPEVERLVKALKAKK